MSKSTTKIPSTKPNTFEKFVMASLFILLFACGFGIGNNYLLSEPFSVFSVLIVILSLMGFLFISVLINIYRMTNLDYLSYHLLGFNGFICIVLMVATFCIYLISGISSFPIAFVVLVGYFTTHYFFFKQKQKYPEKEEITKNVRS